MNLEPTEGISIIFIISTFSILIYSDRAWKISLVLFQQDLDNIWTKDLFFMMIEINTYIHTYIHTYYDLNDKVFDVN